MTGKALWVGWQAPDPIQPLAPKKLASQLGSEADLLVFDALEGFDPDAFAMALGLLRGGGCFLLLTPPLTAWPAMPDRELTRLIPAGWPVTMPSRFIHRLVRLLENRQWQASAPPPAEPGKTVLTHDQEQALELFQHAATGHAGRPLVITADRGRGKSTLLGMGAAWLMQHRPCQILVTAPHRTAVEILFRQAQAALPHSRATKGGLAYQASTLDFIAPDALVAERPHADLLLVDEAAGIPLPLLERLVQDHRRTVLASTIHGYEGSGRGFLLRLQQLLDRIRPQWQGFRLEQPVRWAAGDPLEQFGFEALLLDAEPVALEGSPPAAECHVRRIAQEELLGNETLLKQLFGLLVSAHYRTTPQDLRYLLDAPNLAVQGLFHQDQLLGAALLAREGDLSGTLREAILSGHRRPRGHLLPQLLATRCGLAEALEWRCERVVRIAIHHRLQGRGLGSHLLRHLVQEAPREGVALLGTSFGATAPLVRFWQAGGFIPVRLGHRREASSGAHAVVMVQGLTHRSRQLMEKAANAFRNNFPLQLGEQFTSLEAELALLLRQPQTEFRLEREELAVLTSFAKGRLPYLDALASLHRLSCQLDGSTDPRQHLLVLKVLQHRDWAEVARLLGLPGRRAVEKALRQAVLDLTQCLVGKQ
jgi:tRNA(Met) cytidine acetyltransferase